jgi:ankyrin repeat protein
LITGGDGNGPVLVFFPMPDANFLVSENVGLLVSHRQIRIPFGQRIIGKDTIDIEKTLVNTGSALEVIFQSGNIDDDLCLSAKIGENELVAALLSEGANPNKRTKAGFTPLILSSMEGHGDIVKLLLAKNADVNVKTDNGNSALTAALSENHTDIVKTLLSKGANINAPLDNGFTPLMIAVVKDNTEMVKHLIVNGANVNAKTNDGKYTALKIAEKGNNNEIIQLLRKAGVRER